MPKKIVCFQIQKKKIVCFDLAKFCVFHEIKCLFSMLKNANFGSTRLHRRMFIFYKNFPGVYTPGPLNNTLHIVIPDHTTFSPQQIDLFLLIVPGVANPQY